MLSIPDLRRALRDDSFAPPMISRRAALVGLAAVFPVLTLLSADDAEARNKNKKKRRKKRKKRKKDKPPANNAFGCLDVGQHCNGDGSRCCSGICDGTKPKKGKKDKSTCVGHNGGPCQDAFDVCEGVPVACSAGNLGACFKTTGNAPFCGVGDTPCVLCQRDDDCVALGFGPGSACVVCRFLCGTTSGGTMCIAAGA